MDWVTEPHPLDPVIAAAVFHVENLLTSGHAASKRGVPILTRFDIELAGFDYDAVMEAGRHQAP
jgi:hypothetical protein